MAGDFQDLPIGPTDVTGTFTMHGLTTGGLVTEVELVDTEWRPIPPTPLAKRNAMSIQNESGGEIKVNYVDDVGYIGMKVKNTIERAYDISDSIIMYGRAAAGTLTVTVEEIA